MIERTRRPVTPGLYRYYQTDVEWFVGDVPVIRPVVFEGGYGAMGVGLGVWCMLDSLRGTFEGPIEEGDDGN